MPAMKTSFCVSAAIATTAVISVAEAAAVTMQQSVAMLDASNFTYSLGGPEPSALVDGFQIRPAFLAQFPALEGYGIAMALVNMDACTINLPHLHPRATELSYVITGEMRTAFVEENGGDGAVVNDLSQGDIMFFPQGLIHYQQNLGCEPVTFIAALNNEDPGAVTVQTRYFELPEEAIKASLNYEDETLQAFLEGLPMAPAEARKMCLEACGMADPDMDMDEDEHDEHEDDDCDDDEHSHK